MKCLKCETELPEQQGAGRPRKYCSDACQRAAALEIKRLDSRIAKLERDESTWRVRGADGYAKNAAHEIKRLEARLVQLVAADAEGGDL
ncbi:MAG: hypothetical protein IT510_07625 [Sulfuritalea sp.]|nr:hypothetical protein [Sulfuritalea sp.]